MSQNKKINLPPHLLKKMRAREDAKSQLKTKSRINYSDVLRESKNSIEQALKQSNNTLNPDLNCITQNMVKFQKIFDEHSNTLSNYDLQNYQKFMKNIQHQLSSNQPELDINFKNLNKDLLNIFREPITKITPKETNINNIKYEEENILIQCLINENIILDQMNKSKSLIIDTLENCHVELKFEMPSLKINNCSNCQIFLGPVNSSIYIDNCNNCELNLVSRQLRIHSSNHLKLCVLVLNRIVIEDSNKLVFAKFKPFYDDADKFEKDIKQTQIDLDDCDWRQIDDFNWINPFESSPNFEIIQ